MHGRLARWGIRGCALGFCVVSIGRATAATGVRVRAVSSLVKVLPGETPECLRQPVRLFAVRGEYESFQLLLDAGVATVVRVSVVGRDARDAGVSCRLFRVLYVHVRTPSRNRDARPHSWPDPLLPWSSDRRLQAAAGARAVLWVRLHISRRTPPGRYTLSALAQTESGVTEKIPVELNVLPLDLPRSPAVRGTAAIIYPALMEWFNHTIRPADSPWMETSPEWQQRKRRIYEFLLDYGICGYELPVALDSEEAERYLDDERVHSFRLPWIYHDEAQYGRLISRLRQRGWLSKAFYYQADEPVKAQFEDIRSLARKLRVLAPGAPQLVTIAPTPALVGAVDIWCPNLGDFIGPGHLDLKELAHRRRLGEQTWWYTCTTPRYPYPTWLVDDDATAHLGFMWLMARHGITGFVYSMVHGWGPDPFDSVASFAGSNGDGTLVYPGELRGIDGPLPSLRLEIIRDGLEDCRLFAELRRGLNARLPGAGDQRVRELTNAVVPSVTSVSREAQKYLDRRRRLLEELVDLRRDEWLAIRSTPEAETTTHFSAVDLRVAAPLDAEVCASGRVLPPCGDDRHRQGRVLLRRGLNRVVYSLRAGGRVWTAERLYNRRDIARPRVIETIATYAGDSPRIDGRLDDPCWAKAKRVRIATQLNGVAPATRVTTARLVWDQENLYAAFHGELDETTTEAPDNRKANWVALQVDAGPTRREYWRFVVTPKGAGVVQLFSRDGCVPRLQPNWDYAVRSRSRDFTAELRVPFSVWGAGPDGTSFTVSLVRHRRNELDVWPTTWGDITRFARLLFVGKRSAAIPAVGK